jgi:hypothetical protein
MPPEIRNVATVVLLLILLLTAVAALLANLGLFGLDPNSNFAKTTLAAVLLEVVAAVVLVWKTGALQRTFVSAIIRFPDDIQPGSVDLDLSLCCFEVRDMKAEIKSSGKVNVVWGFAGWECRFPSPTDLDESITLTLKERNGRTWEVRPFYPLSRDVVAVVRDKQL